VVEKSVILIVDDVPANVQVLASCLKNDYHIKVATDGLKCLQLVAIKPTPDLILLDIEMPGMDGYEVCRRLKADQETQKIPIIFVTASDQEEEEEKGLQLGAVDYITKPIRPSIVSARVNTHITLKLQHDKLMAMAMHDQLTGLYNRHYFFDSADKKIAEAKRHHYPLSLVMMDIDHFKHINDQYGHAIGDKVLQSISQMIKAQCRDEDILARFGGEEFIALFNHCDMNYAYEKAENCRQIIETTALDDLYLTCSFGVVQMSADCDSLENLIKQADMALYQAKEGGRNQVVCADNCLLQEV